MAKTGDDRATGSLANSDGMQEASHDPYLLARMLSSLVTRMDTLEKLTTGSLQSFHQRCDDEEISANERFGNAVQLIKEVSDRLDLLESRMAERLQSVQDRCGNLFDLANNFEDRIDILGRSVGVIGNRTLQIAVLDGDVAKLIDRVRVLSEELSRLKPASQEPPAEKPLADDDLVNLDGWLGREDHGFASNTPSKFKAIGFPVIEEWLKVTATIKGVSPMKSTGGPLYPVHIYRSVARYIHSDRLESLSRFSLIKYLVKADGVQKACNGKV